MKYRKDHLHNQRKSRFHKPNPSDPNISPNPQYKPVFVRLQKIVPHPSIPQHKPMRYYLKVFLILLTLTGTGFVFAQNYRMPGEDEPHEGTWIQWPHNQLYGPYYQDDVEPGWITLTDALQAGEKVHIIAYDNNHKNGIVSKLNASGVPLTNIDFFLIPTDDVWVRDNGPIFVYDENDNQRILDWGFNGWGFDTPYSRCDTTPLAVSRAINIPRTDLSAMVLEGGAIEHDGKGTMMATRSCITHSSRNPNLSETQIENYLSQYLGITKFIWLDGVYGQDITDHHIDGFVKFANDSTLVTMDSLDLDYWLVTGSEIQTIYSASNAQNVPYNIVKLPLTQNNVKTTMGTNLGLRGSYCNYYIGNEVVVVPVYNDPNDNVALSLIQSIHPNRTVVGMNVQNLYEYGGMTHCVTQQQPIDLKTTDLGEIRNPASFELFPNFPNPCEEMTNLHFSLQKDTEVQISLFDLQGRQVVDLDLGICEAGEHLFELNTSALNSGMYFCKYRVDQQEWKDAQRILVK